MLQFRESIEEHCDKAIMRLAVIVSRGVAFLGIYICHRQHLRQAPEGHVRKPVVLTGLSGGRPILTRSLSRQPAALLRDSGTTFVLPFDAPT